MVYRFYVFVFKKWRGTIIDLYDRSVVASSTERHISSEHAVCTLQKALDSTKRN